MSLLRAWRRLLALGRIRHDDEELAQEIQAHLELAERDALAAGLDSDEARREALARFGSIGGIRDAHRDTRTLAWIENLWQDVRHATRSLCRDRAFTVVSVAVLAAAIGVGTMVFSIADAVSLRALPFADPDRLAAVVEYTPPRQVAGSFAYGYTTLLTFLDWRREQSVFDGLTAIHAMRHTARHPGAETPMTLFGARVSHEFFPVFRVRPLLGRAFLPEDEVDGNHRVVMLGHAFWADAFGGAPAVIGQTIELDSEMYRIVGVMPEDFTFRFPVTSLQETQIYVPLRIRAVDRVRGQSRNYNYTIVGRLKQGVDMAVASDSMATLSRGLAEQYPDWWSNRQADVVPLHQHLAAHVAPRMRLLLLAIVGVMVVACVNVANLLLVRSTVRVRDTSMRAALGAPRSRLVRIMMVEGLIIAASASVLGLGIAHGLVVQAIAWLPPDLPRINSVAVDGRVTAMAVAAAMFTHQCVVQPWAGAVRVETGSRASLA